MKCATVVVGESSSSLDDKLIQASEQSSELAGSKPLVAASQEAVKCAVEAGEEFCHFVWRGGILLPSFYKAMVNACDYAGTDYAFCRAVVFGSKEMRIEVPTPEQMIVTQLLVRRWVIEELGGTGYCSELLKRVLVEYRGTEVPHFLVVEMGL